MLSQEADVEKLQQRDYSNIKDASLLRFLVDMRGVDADDRQVNCSSFVEIIPFMYYITI